MNTLISKEYLKKILGLQQVAFLRYLELCLKVLNAEKILFAVDWPYANNKVGVDWLANAPIDTHTKKMIFSENAQNLFNL